MNHLGQLISEWLEHQGYLIRRNIKVGKFPQGGYECELDIVGFNPITKHLIQIEPSTDLDSWEKREARYKKKFDAGKKYIFDLFKGFQLPQEIDQRAVFLFGGKTKSHVGGGKVYLVKDVLKEIYEKLKKTKISSNMVPEEFPNLRTFQLIIEFKRYLFKNK